MALGDSSVFSLCYRNATTIIPLSQYHIDTDMLPIYNQGMNILKEKRESQALSQQNLADRSNVAKSTIVRIENEQHKPNWITIRKLAEALQCDPSELIALRKS